MVSYFFLPFNIHLNKITLIKETETTDFLFLDLAMSTTLLENECSICELPFRTAEVTVTTECGHTFHRTCAQTRLDEKHKSDCRTCGKLLALTNALAEHQTTTTTISTERDPNHNQPVSNVSLFYVTK
jgi:hypothetical protein